MEKRLVPDYDVCWVCHRLQAQCHEDCPHRLPPDHPSLRGMDGKLMSKNDMCGNLIHFQHGQEQLRKMGLHVLADIPFYSNPLPLAPSSVPQPQLSPSSVPQPQSPSSVPQPQMSPGKRKWSKTGAKGKRGRSAKGIVILDPINEAPMAQSIPQPGSSGKSDHQDLKGSVKAGLGNPDVAQSSGLVAIAKADKEVQMIEEEAKWEFYRFLMDENNQPLRRSNSKNTKDEFDDIDLRYFDAE